MSKKKTINRDAGVRSLPIKLTDQEKIDHGNILAQTEIELGDKLADFKAVAATHRGEVEAMRVKIAELSKILEAGEIMREVETREEVDLDKKQVKLIRKDTDEVVSVRDAEPGELRGVLFSGE